MTTSARVLGLLLVGLGLLWGPRPAPAQEVLTLERALEIALTQNLRIENAGISVEKLGEDLEALRTRQYPAFTASVRALHNFVDESFEFEQGALGMVDGQPVPSRDVDIDTANRATAHFAVGIEQPLSGLYAIALNIDKLETDQAIARQQLRATQQETARQVKQHYYAILSSQSAIEADKASVAFYQDLVATLQNKVAQKTALDYELLDAEARLAKAQHDVLSNQTDLANSKETLNKLMGRDLTTDFTLVEAFADPALNLDPGTAQEQALARRPETRAAHLRLEKAQTERKIEDAGYIPEVGLVANYSRVANSDFIPDESFYVGLIVKWEFFDWGRTGDQVASAAYGVSQAKNAVSNSREQVRSEVSARIRDLVTAQGLLPVTEKAQRAAREKLRVTNNRYKAGAVLLDDLLEAESDLAQANDDFHQARLAVWNAQAALEKAMGED